MENLQITIPCLSEKIDIIIAELALLEYSGFWEDGQLINAYISKADFVEKQLYDMLAAYGMENSYSIVALEDKNWNLEWESNFDPVEIEDKVRIRASFHPSQDQFDHEITINPQMSFGTGHHETTALMIRLMLPLTFISKSVIDLGSGTGVLAILAKQMGALNVVAIENDAGSVVNCRENVLTNGCDMIEVIEGSIENAPEALYDVILSNITKNINKTLLPKCLNILKPKGLLLISGFLAFDKEEMIQYCESLSCRHLQTIEQNRWQAMLFEKK
jgi:ribosomal protein L11 methyltransferase